jgi:hypothetical protein
MMTLMVIHNQSRLKPEPWRSPGGKVSPAQAAKGSQREMRRSGLDERLFRFCAPRICLELCVRVNPYIRFDIRLQG